MQNVSTMDALSAITQICIVINTKKDFKIWSRTCHDLALTLVAIIQMLWSGDTNWFNTCAQAFTLEALTRLNHACILFWEQTRILLVFSWIPWFTMRFDWFLGALSFQSVLPLQTRSWQWKQISWHNAPYLNLDAVASRSDLRMCSGCDQTLVKLHSS